MRSKATIIKPNEITDSNKLNVQYRNNAFDIADLYRNYIQLRNDIESQSLVLPFNINAIESQINNLESTLSILAGGTTIVSLYDDDYVVYPSSIETADKCSYEQPYGEAVLPISSTDIEYHFVNPQTNERVLIQNVDDYVKSFVTNNRFKPKIDRIFENAVTSAVDLNSNKGHVAKIWAKNAQISDITMVYNLDVEEIRTVNSIKIHPIPQLTCSYYDVTIVRTSGTRHTVRDVNDNEILFPIANAKRRNFRFRPTEISGVSLQLNNSNYNVIDAVGTKEFVLGAQLISLEEASYLNQGYVGIKIDVPDGKTKIGKITPLYDGQESNIEVMVYDDETEFNNISDAKIMSGRADTIQRIINTTTTADSIYILFKLTLQDNNATPVLKGCTISWL